MPGAYLGSDYRLVWATAKSDAAFNNITLTLCYSIIYTGKSISRYHQIKALVLSFYLVFWITPATIFRPRTVHYHEVNGMTQAASLLQYHPSEAFLLCRNPSNHSQMIQHHPIPTEALILIVWEAPPLDNGNTLTVTQHDARRGTTEQFEYPPWE